MERHRKRLLGYLSRWGVDPTDGEDLLQDLALKAIESPLPSDSETCYAWLLTILKTLLYRRHRSGQRDLRVLGHVLGTEGLTEEGLDLEALLVDASTPERRVLSRDLLGCVLGSLRRLKPEEQRLLLDLADGRTATSLAEEQGVSRQAIWDRTQRARRHLAANLPPELVADYV
ncbi:MAG: sigma-70 family RNA polymerase sigma factor [Fimbriimonadaceae bacterium]|nr:sigma-70 family RNA polymerase sigma factor [Fimbriimonadaceae bacterium]